MEGTWVEGNQEGRGIYTTQKGVVKIGIWENGQRQKWLEEGNEVQERKTFEKNSENKSE